VGFLGVVIGPEGIKMKEDERCLGLTDFKRSQKIYRSFWDWQITIINSLKTSQQ